jgi:hypothetical protein
MIELDGQLTTDDMVFAVVLCLNGYHPVMERRERGAFWIIPEDELGEEMPEFVADYHRGKLTVEPRRFAREHGAMRKDVYRIMGIESKPKGVRVVRQQHASS